MFLSYFKNISFKLFYSNSFKNYQNYQNYHNYKNNKNYNNYNKIKLFHSLNSLQKEDKKHSDLFNEKTLNTLQFKWKETENNYKINVHLLVQINPNNLSLYTSRQQLIIETYLHPEITKNKTILEDINEPIKPITLCLRKAFNLPHDVDNDNITATLVADELIISMPKITYETGNDPDRKITTVHVSTTNTSN